MATLYEFVVTHPRHTPLTSLSTHAASHASLLLNAGSGFGPVPILHW